MPDLSLSDLHHLSNILAAHRALLDSITPVSTSELATIEADCASTPPVPVPPDTSNWLHEFALPLLDFLSRPPP